MAAFPHLAHGNAATVQLREWLEAQREAAHTALAVEGETVAIYRLQGRLAFLNELLTLSDPAHRPYQRRP